MKDDINMYAITETMTQKIKSFAVTNTDYRDISFKVGDYCGRIDVDLNLEGNITYKLDFLEHCGETIIHKLKTNHLLSLCATISQNIKDHDNKIRGFVPPSWADASYDYDLSANEVSRSTAGWSTAADREIEELGAEVDSLKEELKELRRHNVMLVNNLDKYRRIIKDLLDD